jgi:hypothetical protein
MRVDFEAQIATGAPLASCHSGPRALVRKYQSRPTPRGPWPRWCPTRSSKTSGPGRIRPRQPPKPMAGRTPLPSVAAPVPGCSTPEIRDRYVISSMACTVAGPTLPTWVG